MCIGWWIINKSYNKGAIKDGQSRETGNIEYTRRKKQKNTTCVGHHCKQTNTNNIKKTWALLQTTGDKDEPNIVFMHKILSDIISSYVLMVKYRQHMLQLETDLHSNNG
jgi:hypothetical protein